MYPLSPDTHILPNINISYHSGIYVATNTDITVPQSPQFTLGLTLGMVRSMKSPPC